MIPADRKSYRDWAIANAVAAAGIALLVAWSLLRAAGSALPGLDLSTAIHIADAILLEAEDSTESPDLDIDHLNALGITSEDVGRWREGAAQELAAADGTHALFGIVEADRLQFGKDCADEDLRFNAKQQSFGII